MDTCSALPACPAAAADVSPPHHTLTLVRCLASPIIISHRRFLHPRERRLQLQNEPNLSDLELWRVLSHPTVAAAGAGSVLDELERCCVRARACLCVPYVCAPNGERAVCGMCARYDAVRPRRGRGCGTASLSGGIVGGIAVWRAVGRVCGT